MIKNILSPIISLITITLSTSLFTTFVSLKLKIDGQSTYVVGLMGAIYFAGLVLGSIRIHKLVERIGHIRAFSAFSGMICALTLTQQLFNAIWIWMILRFLQGFLLAGLLIVIESWLLARNDPKKKGFILAVYMIVYYGSQSLSQFLLNITNDFNLYFVIAAIFAALSIVPVCLTSRPIPIIENPSLLNIFNLFKLSPVGLFGAFLSGLILGPIYSMLPIFIQETNNSITSISLIMGITIFGGLILQWPIGVISDYFDRRKILAIVSFLTIFFSLIICLVSPSSFSSLLIFFALLGGCSFTIYPLSICHTTDLIDFNKDIVATTAVLYICYGIGAVIGPLLASYSMNIIGPYGLFYYISIFTFIFSIYLLFKIFKKMPPNEEDKIPFSNAPRTSSSVSELNPDIKKKK